ncbi:MAG: tRNA (adenosine(37)-N6)-threonylcarbamoyltransferase complex transferase subunit TsaD [Rhodospirillaceae bacterium]
MIVLGIETSCDETAAAVVDDDRRVLANVVLSQIDDHRPYGGVVPEIAARAHVEAVDAVVADAIRAAGVDFSDLAGVAATGGPGLIGGVMVGVMTAKAIAFAEGLPFLAVNHLEAHALTARLDSGAGPGGPPLAFPYLLLLVSGGHCQLLAVEGVGRYRRLGTTIDDALGEAFDKTAKMLGLGYPGGPAVERRAAGGDAARFDLPRPMQGRDGCNFSFSGLKTKVRQTIEGLPAGALTDGDIDDLCASFLRAAGDVLVDRCAHAVAMFRATHPNGGPLVVAGGVAANAYLRSRLQGLCAEAGIDFLAPPAGLCTDNGAMVAWAGLERLRNGDTDGLDFKPRPRWPLDPGAAPAAFAGVKA